MLIFVKNGELYHVSARFSYFYLIFYLPMALYRIFFISITFFNRDNFIS